MMPNDTTGLLFLEAGGGDRTEMAKLRNVCQFFQNLDELVYAADIETHELVYLNQKALDAFGLKSLDEIKGKKCYEVLQNSAIPCGVCNNDRLCVGRFEEWRY